MTPLEQSVHTAATRFTRSALDVTLARGTPLLPGLTGVTGGLVHVLSGKGRSLFRAVNFTAAFVQANGELARRLREKPYKEK